MIIYFQGFQYEFQKTAGSMKATKYLHEEITFINLSSITRFKFWCLFKFVGGIITQAVLLKFSVSLFASNQTFKLWIFALISFSKIL